jgi:hypothetical protein
MLRPVSGAECARALLDAGFQIQLLGPDYVVAKMHGASLVRVPLVDELNPVQIATILGLTGLTPERFASLLDP